MVRCRTRDRWPHGYHLHIGILSANPRRACSLEIATTHLNLGPGLRREERLHSIPKTLYRKRVVDDKDLGHSLWEVSLEDLRWLVGGGGYEDEVRGADCQGGGYTEKEVGEKREGVREG